MAILRCPVVFFKVADGVASGVFLSQAYALQKIAGEGEWWMHTQGQWVKSAGINRRQQEGARAKLKALGILEEKREGIPARLYFRLNSEALAAAIAAVKQAA